MKWKTQIIKKNYFLRWHLRNFKIDSVYSYVYVNIHWTIWQTLSDIPISGLNLFYIFNLIHFLLWITDKTKNVLTVSNILSIFILIISVNKIDIVYDRHSRTRSWHTYTVTI